MWLMTKMVGAGDVLGSIDSEVSNPIVGSWFRIEPGPQAEPPKYEYDEVGIVIEGKIYILFSTEYSSRVTYHVRDQVK